MEDVRLSQKMKSELRDDDNGESGTELLIDVWAVFV